MKMKVLVLAAVVAIGASGCAHISPPPSMNFGDTAFSAEKGETSVSLAGGGGSDIFEGGYGGELRASHQVDDRLRVGIDGVGALQSGSYGNRRSPANNGTLTSSRLFARYDLADGDSSSLGLVAGMGGGFYSAGDLFYATGDLGLPVDWRPHEAFSLYGGPVAGVSVPVRQDELTDSDGERFQYPTTSFAGLNVGAAAHLAERASVFGEMDFWRASPGSGDAELLLGLSLGLNARF